MLLSLEYLLEEGGLLFEAHVPVTQTSIDSMRDVCVYLVPGRSDLSLLTAGAFEVQIIAVCRVP